MTAPDHADTVRTFAYRLRAARERHGLTQAALAGLTGMPVSAISHYETGRREPNPDNLRALATALGGSADYLLGLKNVLRMIRPDGAPEWAEMP